MMKKTPFMASHKPKRRRLNPSQLDKGGWDSEPESDFSDPPLQNGSQNIPVRSTKNASTGAKQSGNHRANTASGASVFRLQLDELLAKVHGRPSQGSRMKSAEDALRKLRRVIEHIPDREPTAILKAEQDLRVSHKVQVPFPEPRPGTEAKYLLAYSKPANINIVGSYARKTAVNFHERVVIDLAVTMPSTLFQEKDYLNNRYFYKRAYYLACLAAGVEENQSCNYNISFAYQSGNQLQPIILIDPVPDSGEDDFSASKCQIRIIIAADAALFPISNTLPQKNCIRSKHVGRSPPAADPEPTPLYNGTIRSECSTFSYLELLQKAAVYSDSFGEACSLGSIWLHQRGFGASLANGGFGQFEWACMMAILLRGGSPKGLPVLSKGYNNYSLFKATLQYLAATDLISKPFLEDSDEICVKNNEYPLFFDGKRGLNILFKMSRWGYEKLRHEASLTITTLNQKFGDNFVPTFITRVDEPLHMFDYVFNIPVSPTWKPTFESQVSIDRVSGFCSELYKTLTTGLGDRVKLIYPQHTDNAAWPVTSTSPKSRHTISVGLLFNAEHVGRIVDHGPPVEDKNAAAVFRAFWGDKAELRRFKDGSIEESLIWDAADGQTILDQIIKYVLQRHLGQEIADKVVFSGNSFDHLIPDPISSNPLAVYQPTMNAFETLEREIRGLEGLPLQIRQISAASPQLRYSSYEAPTFDPFGSRRQPADVYVQFEGSNRWPNDLLAIQRTKFAFLLKIGELLESSSNGLVARLGLENEQEKLLNQGFLDIVYPESASFRLRIHHEHELRILELSLQNKSSNIGKREELAHALSKYKRDCLQRPLHTQAVRTLSTRFPLLSPSIRLMKKWRDSHLLTPHISDELIELLSIRTFITPYPWHAPGSVMSGFVRTLSFLSKWEWQSEPLIVDFSNGEMSAKEYENINVRFQAWRKLDPGMNRVAMFAASNLDSDGISWTEHRPAKVVAARLISLAKAACNLVKEQKLSIQAKSLFISSTDDYDFVIHLNPKLVGGGGHDHQQKRQVFKNLQYQDPSLAAFDPVQLYLDELIRLYSNNILFFYGANGGLCIAGLWNPHVMGSRDWKVNLTYSTKLTKQSDDADAKLIFNKAATLHDIASLGGDMVSRIEVKQ